jgi:hypothetical protein
LLEDGLHRRDAGVSKRVFERDNVVHSDLLK